MVNQEKASPRIPNINATTREAPTRVSPRPEVRPIPVSPEPPRKSLHERLAGVLRNRLVRLGLATGVIGLGGGGGLYETYQNIPAVHRAVDNLIGTDTVPPVPSAFDNSAEKITIGENNTIPVDQTALSTLPLFDENGEPLLLFDLKLPKGTTISGVKNLDVPFISKDIVDKARIDGTRDSLITPKVPAGTQIIAPIDGRVFVMAYEENGERTPPVGVTVEFMGPNNILYLYNISLDVVPSNAANIITINVNAPIKGRENSNGREWKKGLPVKRGEILFTTNQEVAIHRFLQGGTNGSLGPDGTRIPGDIQLLTNSSQKLLVLQ